MAMLTAAWARVGRARHALSEDEPFTFGRAETCSVVLDPDDIMISRLAGSVEYDKGAWWLINRSNVRALTVVDELGFRNVLPPGRRIVLDAPVAVGIDAMKVLHEIVIVVPRTAGQPPDQEPLDGTRSSIGNGVLINEADRLAMVALFAGYLDGAPRHDPQPNTYAAAAARLGWPKPTLIKRVEYLRNRLTNAGVPNLMGWNALSALAEYAISAELITTADLALIKR